ncbi:MAG: O-antigen ligase family protein, partial [Candidatus Margulisiibacteriota bacterium]
VGYFLFSQIAFVVMIYSLEAQDVLVWYLAFGLITLATILFAFNYYKLHPFALDFLFGASLILIYVCLLYTQSRGGYLGFFTAAVFFALAAGRNWLLDNWRKLSVLFLIILAITAYTMSRPEFSPFERFASEITTVEEKGVEKKVESRLELKGAAGSRGETWKSAFKIIADNPLFGVGPEVLKMVFPRYETELFRFKEAFHVKQDRCHNETFDVPVTKGLIAFFAYLWILATVFVSGGKKLKNSTPQERLLLAGVLAAILAYLIQNQFSFGVVAITSLFWILWAMVGAIKSEEKGGSEAIKISEFPYLFGALVGVVVIFLVYLSFISFRADIYFKSGKTYLEMRQFSSAVKELKESLQIYPFEGVTISHLAIAYLNMGNVSEAIKYLIYGTQVDPFNADNFLMLGKVYLSFYDRGQKEALVESKKYADIALKIDPYYAEAYELKGQIAERQGKLNEAWNWYQKAYEVNPTLVSVMQKIEEFAKKLGKSVEARKLLESGLEKFPDNIDIFKTLERLP